MQKSERNIPDNFIRTEINGDTWTIYLVEDDDEVQIDRLAAAETDFEAREIVVKNSEVEARIIRHEIWHAFTGYLYLSDTNDIPLGDLDEIYAGLFEDRGELMLAKAEEIYRKLLVLKSEMK